MSDSNQLEVHDGNKAIDEQLKHLVRTKIVVKDSPLIELKSFPRYT